MRNRSISVVVLADVVLTYAYVFAAHTVMDSAEVRAAPPSHWLAQPWVYSLIAPIAAVASWRGARQVLDAWAGRPRWWRLPVEGVVIGIACMLLVTRPLRDGSDVAAATRDAVVLCGGLGLLLTCANVPLARRLRPGAASTAGGPPHDAPGLAPHAG